MDNFLRELLTEWRRLGLPFEGETLTIAVSGGADSVSLLLALADLRSREKFDHRLVAAHFDHKLRGTESDRDREFVKHLVGELGIELVLGEAGPLEKGNLEQSARRARYDFLSQTAGRLRARYVLTGHTLNDQAETFLMNLVRGSGIDGLTGMRTIRTLYVPADSFADEQRNEPQLPFGDRTIDLVRPLLSWAKRRDTENFCRLRGVDFRLDSMNEDLAFTRVRIRKLLLPMLEEFNPNIIETLAKTADLLRAEATPMPLNSENSTEPLSLVRLKELSQSALYNELRGWLAANRGNLRGLGLKHIQAVERLIHSRKSGKTVEIPGGQRVSRQAGKLVFEQIMVEK